jgi:hypothetical protein
MLDNAGVSHRVHPHERGVVHGPAVILPPLQVLARIEGGGGGEVDDDGAHDGGAGNIVIDVEGEEELCAGRNRYESGFRVEGLGFGVWCLGFRVGGEEELRAGRNRYVSGFRVEGFWVWGLG